MHNTFAQKYLAELLSPLGTVELNQKITTPVRYASLFFTPHPREEPPTDPPEDPQITPPDPNTDTLAQKQLGQLLSPLGTVEINKEIPSYDYYISLLFTALLTL